uniref:Uncharacterized protein n=1 Tax=Picea glauca TaxID=3330 RepID=A0A101LY26_PICGL|nr:hypothetical protein ABT39_MTgene5640 [Picea glauca]
MIYSVIQALVSEIHPYPIESKTQSQKHPQASRPAYPFPGPVKARQGHHPSNSCGWESKTSSRAKRDMASRQLSSLSVTSEKGEGSGRGFHMHGQQAWS